MYYKRKRYFNDVHKTFVSMFVFLCKVLWAFKVSWKTAFDIVYALFELWLGVVFNLCSFRQFMFLKNCVSVFCFKKFLLYFYSSHELMKFKLKISAIIYIFFNLFSVFFVYFIHWKFFTWNFPVFNCCAKCCTTRGILLITSHWNFTQANWNALVSCLSEEILKR